MSKFFCQTPTRLIQIPFTGWHKKLHIELSTNAKIKFDDVTRLDHEIDLRIDEMNMLIGYWNSISADHSYWY